MSMLVIMYIVVGCVVFIIIVSLIVYCCIKRKQTADLDDAAMDTIYTADRSTLMAGALN